VRFELTNPLRPDLKPGAFDQLGNPCADCRRGWELMKASG
jgi:hypothetical protein